MLLKWTRPADVPYPIVWLSFEARDVDSDNMVNYRIEDLMEDRFDEVIDVMARDFLADAPMAKSKDAANDKEYVEDNICLWRIIVKQRMTQVCFKEGSDQIIGAIMNYVSSKDDDSDHSVINNY